MSVRLLLVFVVAFLSTCTSKSTLHGLNAKQQNTRILIFSGAASFAERQLQDLAVKARWQVSKAAETSYFPDDSLAQYSSIFISFSAFNNLNHRNITSLKRYLEAGGGVVAIKDTVLAQTGWPWLATWNDLEAGPELNQDNGRLLLLPPSFTEAQLQKAFKYTVGRNTRPDYSQTTTLAVPEASRYTQIVLSQGMDEPMQMAILPNNNVLFVERKGSVKLYNAAAKETTIIANFDVFSGIEDGLLGVALDPNFAQNNWVYFYYAVAGQKAINRLTRMELRGDNLVRTSEKILLQIPTQRQYCCHMAGYIAFGPDGLLYLSTGDNTNAEETEGYIPIDERPGRQLADDQATAANTNDLRGKILRIKPEPDGTYSIPAGNLFPVGTPKARPEIYTMGHRNPYRFSIDKKNGFVYWGDIGPDTKVPSSEGTLSFDEINQARGPGFFGWPYFLGNNEVFPYYDYATKKIRPITFNPKKPLNNSPNNTGLRELPPTQPALIWYGDGLSKKFPLVGKGGETAMAGPVYYSDLFPHARYKLADYYHGKLFIYDWVRRWFMAVTLDENKNYLRMEPFLDHLTFTAPTDMQFAADGAIYILEYGSNWFAKNSDARLVRIEYTEGNRKPVANIQVAKLNDAVPFKVDLSATDSKDYDQNDKLQFSWQLDGKDLAGEKLAYTLEKPGTYPVTLTVKDNHGESSTATVILKAGNAPPVVSITTDANQSFYWDNVKLNYKISISDLEDKIIHPQKVEVSFNYLPRGKDIAVALTSTQAPKNMQYLKGQYLLTSLDCKACHALDKASVGPSYTAVAARYASKPGATEQLAQKIIKGGSGNWGQRSMSSHPNLASEDAKEIVQYILSLKETATTLPLQGSLTLKEHTGKGNEGSYLLLASYTDNGANGVEPLMARSYITLRNPLVQIEDYDEGNVRLGTNTTEFLTYATNIRPNSFVKFKQLDLTQVKSLKYRVLTNGLGGNIEVRLDRPDGKVVSTVAIPAGKSKAWQEITASVSSQEKGAHDVYFLFTNSGNVPQNLFNLDWVYFSNK